MKLSAANLIFRGIKNIRNIASLTSAMPPSDTVLCYSDDPMNLFQDIGFDKTDKEILSLIDGKRSIHDILSGSPLDNVSDNENHLCSHTYEDGRHKKERFPRSRGA